MVAELFVLAVFPLLLAIAAGWDITSFTIPNIIPLALFATFAIMRQRTRGWPHEKGDFSLGRYGKLVLGTTPTFVDQVTLHLRDVPWTEALNVVLRTGVIVTGSLIAGFYLWQLKSLEEAIEWVKRVPNCSPTGEGEVEIRQVFEPEDFAYGFSEEGIQQEKNLRAQLAAQAARR